ncbi:hypothetical protein BWR19_17325 [Halomonas sp. 1513]|nr:hypothetical protein BWR19_17325 [Halomonas sp. 1513]
MNNKGFTLIELLVTLAVAIILATVAVPNFSAMMNNNRLVSDYNEIISGVNYARSEAIKRREEVTFTLVNESPWEYRVKLENDDDIRIRNSRDSRMAVASDGNVTFNSLGRTVSGSDCEDGCLLNVRHDIAGCRAVTVSRFGRVARAEECAETSGVITP